MNSNNIILIGIGAAILAVGAYVIVQSSDRSAVTQPATAQTQSTNFNLSRSCAQDAATYFQNKWGATSVNVAAGDSLNYQDHYNTTLNKCLILVDWKFHVISTSNNSDLGFSDNRFLVDVEANATLGSMTFGLNPDGTINAADAAIDDCTVNGQKCTSIEGFVSLATPYLTN
ncbi:MAG: hypothetical protein P4L81_04225 [Candidatus Pacebacteria bacterium]|nr:hypothetical protein [Candidatus Paceibacterota bacterium]